MKRSFAIFGFCVACAWSVSAQSDDLLSRPLLVVTPSTIDFGEVPRGTTVTNTFLIQNMGEGRLKGKATVSAPFKIVDGNVYSLAGNEAQVVTLIYTPSKKARDRSVVRFTGGHGGKATVTGERAAR